MLRHCDGPLALVHLLSGLLRIHRLHQHTSLAIMWELPKLGEPTLVDINQSLVTAIPVAYYAKTEQLLHYPFQHADKVLLKLVDLTVDKDCRVTVEVAFKVSHFKNMLRASLVAIEREKEKKTKKEQKHESLSESFRHFIHAS